jgi:pyruvate dehydrogenase (quinone)
MLMGDFVTAVRYKLPIKVVIMKNNSLGQIKSEQMVFLGNPEFGCDLMPIDFAAFARACGAKGYTIHEAAECGDILDEALRADGPAVIEAVVDANEPPMPPRITARQAAHFAESLAKGTPDRKKIMKDILEDRVRELV